jgi:hypothetical protein
MVGFVVVHILLSTFNFIRNFNNLFITERGFKMHHEKHRDIVCPSSSNRLLATAQRKLSKFIIQLYVLSRTGMAFCIRMMVIVLKNSGWYVFCN